ncbi:calcium/sodium antiporter [Patescibacteria group bacterium]|nr:calcium/sodium antiporter [Patescibacteria group bacterium]
MLTILPSILLFAVGIALLYKGALLLIENATKLARNFGLPLILIGFTIVAFGTSLPELIIGIFSGLAGENSLTLGNVLGGNMVNLGVALGLTALIAPIGLPAKNHRFELYSLVFALAILYMLLRDGLLSRFDGLILVTMAIVFILAVIREATTMSKVERVIKRTITIKRRRERLYNIIAIAAGLALLFIGARMTVVNAVSLARLAGVSEVLIGLTLIALGTSLPEILTTIISAIKKTEQLSIGNIIGSNVMNVLLILGVSVLISPIKINQTVWQYDLPFLLLTTLIFISIVRSSQKISRREGLLLLSAYVIYVLFAFLLRL